MSTATVGYSRSDQADLALVTEVRADGLVVSLVGRLDRRTAALLVGCVRSWADAGTRDLILDLGGLSAADGHGLVALLRSRRVLRARAGGLQVVNTPAYLRPTLVRAGLAA